MSFATKDPVFQSIGDMAHYGSMAFSLLFAYVVIRYSRDPNDTFFDESWKKDGFCVTNKDIPYWTSHDVCMYYDTIATIVCGLVYLALRKTPGLEKANPLFTAGIFGVFAHGLGHGSVGHAMRLGNFDEDPDSLAQAFSGRGLVDILKFMSALVIFWVGLIKASAPHLKSTSIGALVLAAIVAQVPIPGVFGFTYVQTVLMMVFSLNQLARKKEEKDYIYATYPLIAGIPTTFIGWIESTQCSAFVKDKFYGHVIYDGFIPLAMVTWYILCYIQVTSQDQPPKAAVPTKDKDA